MGGQRLFSAAGQHVNFSFNRQYILLFSVIISAMAETTSSITLSSSVIPDPWSSLRAFTAARIALGRTGTAIPLRESLQFKLAHAHARDAVYASLDIPVLTSQLQTLGLPVLSLQSMAANRAQYLQRPDLGRKLQADAAQRLQQQVVIPGSLAILLADGLCATAINRHAVSLLELLVPQLRTAGFSLLPVCLVQQGRVALADEAGALLQAAMTIVLIGERPGLSSPDSMGAYLTYAPAPGLTDEARNCVSNIRPGGLGFAEAAGKIQYLVQEAFRRKLSGVLLKDGTGSTPTQVLHE